MDARGYRQKPGPETRAERGCFCAFGATVVVGGAAELEADADSTGVSVAIVVSSFESAGGATSGDAALTIPADASTTGFFGWESV